jgi:signal transduction histidine kinase
LDLSRIDAGKGLSLTMEEMDFTELLRTVYETFKSASSKHKIILTIPEKSETILFDKNKMIQVMTNLLSNALKYSPDGGNITISMEDKDGKIVTTVKDEGLGISKEDLPRIFEKFYRVESDAVKKIGGTGIGLPIVKYMIDLHNGSIDVKSEIGKGSEFTFSIPKIKAG